MFIKVYPANTILSTGASIKIWTTLKRKRLFRLHSPVTSINWHPLERKKKTKEQTALYKFSTKYQWERVKVSDEIIKTTDNFDDK